MRFFRGLGLVRLAVAAVVLVGLGVGWVVNSVQRSAARSDARDTVAWFYKDARYAGFVSLIEDSSGYLVEGERGSGAALQPAFESLDLQNFCNEFDGEGVKCPQKLHFATHSVVLQDSDGQSAHVLVEGRVVPDSITRGRTTYSFSDDTYETFAHIVTVAKQGGTWYIVQIEPLG